LTFHDLPIIGPAVAALYDHTTLNALVHSSHTYTHIHLVFF
jgi:hypothetical protein